MTLISTLGGGIMKFRCFTCPVVFGCWGLNHVIFLKLRKKERTACKAEQIHKMTTIFTQNNNLRPFLVIGIKLKHKISQLWTMFYLIYMNDNITRLLF